MTTTSEQELYQYILQLSEDEKKSVLQMLQTFVRNKSQNTGRISLEQYNRELEDSERQIEAGHFTTQEDLETEMKQW